MHRASPPMTMEFHTNDKSSADSGERRVAQNDSHDEHDTNCRSNHKVSEGYGNGYASHLDMNESASTDMDDSTQFDEIDATTTSMLDEGYIIMRLAAPSIVSQLGWGVPSFLMASYIGRHFGSVYLDGYMLASLTSALCTLSLIEGIFDALDTVMPQSYGARNYAELESHVIRAFVLCCVILVPFISILSIWLGPILCFVGIDSTVAEHAAAYYKVYSLSLPFYVVYYLAADFLSVQNIVMPEMIVAVTNSVLVFPPLLLGLCSFMGFYGAPTAIVLYQMCQATALILYIKWKRPYHPDTWPGLTTSSWTKALRWKPFSYTIWLTMGSLLGSSEWIYWEVLSLIVGTMGVLELSVHTIPTQILTVLFMIPMGIGIGISIRVGNVLPQSAMKAREISFYCICVTIIIFGLMSIMMWVYREAIYSIFTNDPEVIDGCEQIWTKVSFFLFNICIFEVSYGVSNALGQQWKFGIITIVYLWVIGMPVIYYVVMIKKGGLNSVWTCLLPPYFALNITVLISFYFTDWEQIATTIRIREGMNDLLFDLEKDDADDARGSQYDERVSIMKIENGTYGALKNIH